MDERPLRLLGLHGQQRMMHGLLLSCVAGNDANEMRILAEFPVVSDALGWEYQTPYLLPETNNINIFIFIFNFYFTFLNLVCFISIYSYLF